MVQESVVLALVPNLFFAGPLRDTAQRLGYRVEFVRDERDFTERLQGFDPKLLVLDLAASEEDWARLIRAAKVLAAAPMPILAFGNHLDLAARERALAAGADVVVSNARFVTELPRLLEKYVEKRDILSPSKGG